MKNVFFETTKRTLKRSRARAAATLVGVIISVAMITTVLFFSYNIYNFDVEVTKSNNGNWSIAVENADENLLKEAQKKKIPYGSMQAVGYSALLKGANPQKPFIYLVNMDEKMEEISNINMLRGRMPKNNREIALPEHLATNGGVNFEIGDKVIFKLGSRINIETGDELNQEDDYNSQNERLIASKNHTFTVVGICKRISVEPYMAPGYMAVTKDMKAVVESQFTYFDDDYFEEAKELIDQNHPVRDGVIYNENLLSIQGLIDGVGGNYSLFGVSLVLLILISAGCCILMYNTFAISARERKKQFETFAAVGATETQLRRMTLYEGVFFAGIGIPLGLIAGGIGTFIAIYIFRGKIATILSAEASVPFEFAINLELIVFIAVIAFILIQLSIMIPAYKAGKTRPIEEGDYESLSYKAQKAVVKPPFLMVKLFGAEGMLASKNFRRNRRQYQAAIVSMVMSIVLFVSASGLSIYLENGINAVIGDGKGYDIVYDSSTATDAEAAYYTLSNADGVTDSAYVTQIALNTRLGTTPYHYNIFIVDNGTFKKYADKNGINSEKYFDKKNPKAIAISRMLVYDAQKRQIEDREIFKPGARPYQIRGIVGGQYRRIDVGEYISEIPRELTFGVNTPAIIISEDASHTILKDVNDEVMSGTAMFNSNKISQTFDGMGKLCLKNGFPKDNLKNIAEQRENANSMLIIMRIFSYGFILLISLIAVANVFNTIAANISMRRFEFATLLALGMTRKSLQKMTSYECILFGVKILLYGIPLAILGIVIVHNIVNISMITGFILPKESIIASIICVFMVVIAIMMYSAHKFRIEEPAKILRQRMF